ncbi:Longitudinals lacking protein, isoforms F/I/K/T [Acromyrmex echinatior]|uniref:Longitudinals lacking protein, isoforms F/I/K/T n=1 Tax=Acromyrmex echinatior TaxID=103372 RepID=F4WH43_ACREC|nr:Longitudinals lacking protein, isoforms F/I/K/T [Acromyrmex echinatior]
MTMVTIVANLRMTLRLMVISVGMRDIIEEQINSHVFALILRFLCQLVQQFFAAGVIVITITIRIKLSPSVVIAAAENISGRRPYIAIKEMNAERNHNTSAFIVTTGRKYDRIGFVMRKLTQNLDADANKMRFCQTYNDWQINASKFVNSVRYFNKQHVHIWILEDKAIYARKQGKRSSKSQNQSKRNVKLLLVIKRWKYTLKKKCTIEDEKESSYRNINLMFVRFKRRIVVAVPYTNQYRCDKCNKKVYKNKGSLIRHTKNECGKLPQFNCLYCKYKIEDEHTLYVLELIRSVLQVMGSRTKRRSRNALPHKRYNCHKCGIKSYVNKSTLNRHLREECNMEPQNSCPYCNKRIHQRCNFQRHIKKVHHTLKIQLRLIALGEVTSNSHYNGLFPANHNMLIPQISNSIKVLLYNSQIAKQIPDPVIPESFFKQNCTMSIKNKFHAFTLELTLGLTSQTKCSALCILSQTITSLRLILMLVKEQTPLEILLDANIPVLCESINVSTAGSNTLSIDSAIWKKLQEMFEKETTKINIKLDSLSVKVGSLVEDMKVVKNKIQLNQCEHLRRYVDYSTTLSKNITSMIKMVITRNVAIEYTASKVTPGKALMKDEHLYACIEDILLQNEFQGEIVTTKLLLKALSTSLSNAKDWDGHRKDRDGQRKDRDGQRKDQ